MKKEKKINCTLCKGNAFKSLDKEMSIFTVIIKNDEVKQIKLKEEQTDGKL